MHSSAVHVHPSGAALYTCSCRSRTVPTRQQRLAITLPFAAHREETNYNRGCDCAYHANMPLLTTRVPLLPCRCSRRSATACVPRLACHCTSVTRRASKLVGYRLRATNHGALCRCSRVERVAPQVNVTCLSRSTSDRPRPQTAGRETEAKEAKGGMAQVVGKLATRHVKRPPILRSCSLESGW